MISERAISMSGWLCCVASIVLLLAEQSDRARVQAHLDRAHQRIAVLEEQSDAHEMERDAIHQECSFELAGEMARFDEEISLCRQK
ncbi:MAG: hypothetical protein ACRC56_11840 [Bosea sp. (in: a-proteobacteria)]